MPTDIHTHRDAAIDAVIAGQSTDPFGVLGPHRISGRNRIVVIRTMRPAADGMDVLLGERVIPMRTRHPHGCFEATFDPGHDETLDATSYRLRVHEAGAVYDTHDAYAFGQILSDFDLHLFNEGTHYRAWEKFGSHRMTIDGVRGVHFSVWAPNAQRVSVIGDFNHWDGRVHQMRKLVPSGVWEIFVPDLGAGAHYKFEVRTAAGHLLHKSDPFGRLFEVPPRTASVVLDEAYEWGDADWMHDRASSRAWRERPMSIYEVHTGSWRRIVEDGDRLPTYRELANTLVPYVREMGFTHIELMPVMEHPFSGSWGYQVIGFFAPTSRHGSPDDFRYFVDECHRHGLGVILDWVPGHFPKDAHGLAEFDGTALYEHADPRQGEHQDWGTLIFNYSRSEVQTFLLSNALYWLEEFHVDGLRVDAVASMLYLDYSRKGDDWIPNRFGGRENLDAVAFLQQLNTVTHGHVPGAFTVAEESTAWPAVSRPVYTGGLGFSFKWNMGWMHDMLEYIEENPVHRRWHHDRITFSMLYAFTENFVLPFSHDEVVHGKRSMLEKMPGDRWQKHATLRALYGYMFAHPGKKLLFMGSEFGQTREWNHDASLEWHLLQYPEHEGLRQWVRDLNQLYQREPSLFEVDFEGAGFSWIDCTDNENSVISLLRRAHDPSDFTVIVTNFTPVPRTGYRIGVPEAGFYRELLNSDSACYSGSNMGNAGGVQSSAQPMHGYEQSLSLTIPPLGFVLFKKA